jgi:hypothetical protein
MPMLRYRLIKFPGPCCRAGGFGYTAEKWGTWVITKKEFFETSKNTVFLQFLKTD